MSRIDELIAEHCPDGVEFKALEDIAQTMPGLSGKTKADFSGGSARYVSYKNAFANLAVDQNASDFVVVVPGEKQNALCLGDVVITGSSESFDEVGMSSVVDSDPQEPLYLNSFCFAVRFSDPELILPGFSKYLFRSESIRKQIRATASGVTRINVSKPRFLKVLVPVPPLAVQREIVRILDTFTQLEAELEAELEARKQQYEHYRSSAFDTAGADETRWTTLEGVCSKISSGGTPSTGKTAYYGGDIPWLRTQEVDFGSVYETGVSITEEGLKNSSAKWIPKRCVIVAMYGATAAKVAINEIPLTTNQACCNLQVNPEVAEYRYVYFWIASQYVKLRSLGEGSQANLNARKVRDFPIPLPSLEEQRRIVAILDKFDALVNDLSVGLPAELQARRQQYEYYRDKLLTFKELEVAA